MAEPADAAAQLAHLRLGVEVAGVEVPEVVLPEERHLLAGAMRLHYLDWPADEAAQEVLLLHGGGLTAHTWDLTCLALRPEYHCIALNQRGHGDSEWSPEMDYSLDAYVSDVEQVVEALALDRFFLVGMSLGGLNAIEYAARHSHRLAGLVIVDVGPELRLAGSSRIREFVTSEGEFGSVDDFVERAMRFNRRRHPELLRRSLLHNLRRLPNGNWTWKYDRRHWSPETLEEDMAAIRALSARLPAIECPALVVRGADSDVFGDEDAERLADGLPNARRTTIPDAGHTVQGDNPREFVAELRRFLREVNDRRSGPVASP